MTLFENLSKPEITLTIGVVALLITLGVVIWHARLKSVAADETVREAKNAVSDVNEHLASFIEHYLMRTYFMMQAPKHPMLIMIRRDQADELVMETIMPASRHGIYRARVLVELVNAEFMNTHAIFAVRLAAGHTPEGQCSRLIVERTTRLEVVMRFLRNTARGVIWDRLQDPNDLFAYELATGLCTLPPFTSDAPTTAGAPKLGANAGDASAAK